MLTCFKIWWEFYEEYSDEEESRPRRRRKKPFSRKNKNKYGSTNSKRRRNFNKDDKYRDRKDSAIKKERIPFLVPLMMVPENQVLACDIEIFFVYLSI